MRAYTEAERAALIEHCKMNILQAKGILPTLEGVAPESEVARKVRKELELQEIALAALAAEPATYAIQDEQDRKEGNMRAFNSLGVSAYVNPEKYGLTQLALYTTPPAALRLPDEVKQSDAPCHLDAFEADCWVSGANWMRDAVESVNATAPADAESGKMERLAEDAECVTLCLNDAGVATERNGQPLSLWGRVVEYAKSCMPAPAEENK